MKHTLFAANFGAEHELFQAVAAVKERGWPIVEAYTPYPVHGLDDALDLPRSRLSRACFFSGLLGVVLALGFQFWSTGWDWPLNVGGQPWNSLPAFVPVTFEAMVLFAGLGLFFAWLLRSRLYPGKKPLLPLPGQTDNRFILVFGGADHDIDAGEFREVFRNHPVVCLSEREN